MHDASNLLLIDRDVAKRLLNSDDVIEALRNALVASAIRDGRIFALAREPVERGNLFGIEGGVSETEEILGLKASGFWPSNNDHGGNANQASIVLFDQKTGRPIAFLDGSTIMAMRTSAIGTIGLTAFARQESESLIVFGTGKQAQLNVESALRCLPELKHVRYATRDTKPDANFAKRFESEINVEHVTNVDQAVADSEVLISATPSTIPLFRNEAVQPGTHLNCVGADTRGKREMPAGLLRRVRLFVDDRFQARTVGEAQWAPGWPCTEIGEVLARGALLSDRRPNDITLFDMTGPALQDLVVANRLLKAATENALGTSVTWPWS